MTQAVCLGPSHGASPVERNSLRYLDREKLKVFCTFKLFSISQLNSLISLAKVEFPKANKDTYILRCSFF